MITINANNILVTLIRALPALDAFAASLGDQVTIFTGHNDLFVGRPYGATDKPVDTDYTLLRRDTPPQQNPLGEIYDELRVLADLHGVLMRPLEERLPTIVPGWNPERLYCVDNAYLVRPAVAVFQCRGRALAPPPGHLAAILRGVMSRTKLLHLLLDNRAPAVPGAIELAMRRGADGGYDQPPLLEVMRAVSAAGVVITNAWWVHDLAVADRRPVAVLLPQPIRYGHPYAGGPRVEVVRAGGCLVPDPDCREGRDCRSEPARQCVDCMNIEAAIAQIGRLL